MIRRPRRTTAATVVALVLLALCALVATSCVQILIGQTPLLPFSTLAGVGAQLTGGSAAVLVASGVAALLGLVLLVVAIRPGNPTVLALSDAGTGVETGIARRSIDRALTDAARAVDGISRAGTRTRGRRSIVTAHAAFGSRDEKKAAVTEAVNARIGDIGTARPHRVRVRITSDKEK